MRRSVFDPVPSPNGNHLGQVLDRGAVPGQIHASKPTDKAVEPNDYLANRAILHSELPMAAKCVLIAIADKARHGRSVCTISYADIAELVRLKRRWTITHVQRLARGQWITIQAVRHEKYGDQPNHIRMGPRFQQAVKEQARQELAAAKKRASPRAQSGVPRPSPRTSVRPGCSPLHSRDAVHRTPGMQSTALPGCSPLHP